MVLGKIPFGNPPPPDLKPNPNSNPDPLRGAGLPGDFFPDSLQGFGKNQWIFMVFIFSCSNLILERAGK